MTKIQPVLHTEHRRLALREQPANDIEEYNEYLLWETYKQLSAEFLALSLVGSKLTYTLKG
jgi:hypothetical protein